MKNITILKSKIKVFNMKDNLKHKKRGVLTATDSSVLVCEQNTSFVKGFKRITGLAILLCAFLLNVETINAMELKVRYWTTNRDFTEITDSCRVWVLSSDSTSINRTELIQVEGSFILNKELTKDLTFEVKDHLDDIHQVRLFHEPRRTSEVYLNIGKSEYTFFPVPQPRPFFPTMDKYYIEINFRKLNLLYPTTSVEENLDMVTEKLKSVGFNAYHLEYQNIFEFDTTKNIRSAIEELHNLEYLFIAPFYDAPFYFTNDVYVLFDDAIDSSMIETLLNELEGVQTIYSNNQNRCVVWSKFSMGKAYQVYFKPEAVISLDFLKQLEQLAKKEEVLSIRISIGAPRVLD